MNRITINSWPRFIKRMIARRIDRRVGKIGKSDSYIYRIRELRRVYGCTLLVAKEFADEMFSEYKAKGGPPWHR